MTIDRSPGSEQAKGASGWAVPLGLIALGVIPALGGATRLASFATDRVALSDAARFAAHPSVLIAHIVSASTFALVGAVQFSRGLRRRNPSLHGATGRIVAPAGVVAGLSGIAAMLAYAPAPTAGPAIHGMRLVVGVAMIVFLALGLEALRRRAFVEHGAWMTRAYALASASGTQALVLLPITLVFQADTRATFTLGMALGWLINVAVAEWLVRRAAIAAELEKRSVNHSSDATLSTAK